MDTTNTLRNVYVWSALPSEWMCREMFTGIVACGESRDEALAGFEAIWNGRAPYTLVEHSPPRQKRQDGPQEPVADAQGKQPPGYLVYKRLAKRYHSDVHPGATFTADQVMVAINELWTAMRGGK
jgi:hypothetical protein